MTYCTNPTIPPVPGVTMSLTGPSPAPSSTPTNASGVYTLAGLTSGGSYTVTPTKAALVPGTGNINTVDVVAIQRHVLGLGTLLTGCKLAAADVNPGPPLGVNTVDVVATQRFVVGLSTGIANAGKYQFTPASISYSPLVANQTAQNYSTIVFGDVATQFVHRPEGPAGPSQPAAGEEMSARELPSTVAAVALPEVAVDPSKSTFITAVRITEIDAKSKLVGFQGDITFDERVVSFQSEPVQAAGLTGTNWNVTGNVLPGDGPIRTLRVSAYSTDFTPLSGSGTLFELRMIRGNPGPQSTRLIWAAPPNDLMFIDADLNTQRAGNAAPGSVTTSVSSSSSSVGSPRRPGSASFVLT